MHTQAIPTQEELCCRSDLTAMPGRETWEHRPTPTPAPLSGLTATFLCLPRGWSRCFASGENYGLILGQLEGTFASLKAACNFFNVSISSGRIQAVQTLWMPGKEPFPFLCNFSPVTCFHSQPVFGWSIRFGCKHLQLLEHLIVLSFSCKSWRKGGAYKPPIHWYSHLCLIPYLPYCGLCSFV